MIIIMTGTSFKKTQNSIESTFAFYFNKLENNNENKDTIQKTARVRNEGPL